MNWPVAVAIAGLTVTMIVGFTRVLRLLGRWEQRADLLWGWYLKHHPDHLVGGRRLSEAERQQFADDDGSLQG